jgi:hypothetical protein
MKTKKTKMTSDSGVKRQEAAIKAIIKRYGPVIDLSKAPYLIVEIVHQFGSAFIDPGTVSSGPVPGSHGTPPPPPPGPQGMPGIERLLTSILQELREVRGVVSGASAKLDKLVVR